MTVRGGMTIRFIPCHASSLTLESSKLIYAYKRLLFCKGKVAFGFKLKYNKCKGSYKLDPSSQLLG
ncbi:hypothetical protein [Wolbachia endosymbiont of Drosophila pseudotakahashii]|uniref:Uncharacterized protein n=2 Tax=unclassified Wolbachia TaxID=2640676 RepID=A0AAT9GC60_9RICK|nr:hypothetical protein [Wolbachia endosymbiont of Drosophila pseudotakahashii]UZE38257.1 hypothetical protein ONI09_05130 [Wolbachia endosymbiont of Drosophila pseudotakahashii]